MAARRIRGDDWLRELTAGYGLTGFMPPALPDAAWVLHAMYEHELGPFDMSYVEYLRAFLNRNSASPEIIPGLDPADVFTDPSDPFAKSTGEHPGPRHRRLRWAELARRTGDPVAAEGRLPDHTSFPSLSESGGWPVAITGPPEGSLDRSDWNRLVEILIEHSPQRADTRCLAYCTPLGQGAEDFDNLDGRAGRLADAKALYDHPEEDSWSPSNLWAHERSWVLCTDYDLWATKVAGPPPLVEAPLDDSGIEAVRLPWAPDPTAGPGTATVAPRFPRRPGTGIHQRRVSASASLLRHHLLLAVPVTAGPSPAGRRSTARATASSAVAAALTASA